MAGVADRRYGARSGRSLVTTKLDHALKLAAFGLRVFPIKEGAKAPPLIRDFPNAATGDADQLRAWWAQWPEANIGVSTNGLCVIDVDPKRGGMETLEMIEAVYGRLRHTFCVATPSGGRHYYQSTTRPVANSQDKLGKGIDVRGEGGYVLGPGSVVDGKTYEIVEG